MRRKTWKAEFYPVPADEATASDHEAIAHSLRKWRGMRSAVLKRHSVSKREAFAFQTEGSCALCIRHHDYESDLDNPGRCRGCPLYESGDGCLDGDNTPYAKAAVDGDPEPLIEALEVALINVKEAGE